MKTTNKPSYYEILLRTITLSVTLVCQTVHAQDEPGNTAADSVHDQLSESQDGDAYTEGDTDATPSRDSVVHDVKNDVKGKDNEDVSATSQNSSDITHEKEPSDLLKVNENVSGVDREKIQESPSTMTSVSGNESDSESAISKDVDLGTVTVMGTSESQEVKESGFPVTIIDPEKFAGRAMSVTDLLERIPGVKIKRSGGVGSAAHISIRGLEGKRVQIYIDGSPLNAPDGTLGIDDIPLHVIERIEVYKGVVPAKLGGDGLGGAVNIVIVDLPPRYADFSYSFQSYNVHKPMALAKTYFEKPGIEWGLFFSGQYADNDYEMPMPDGGTHTRDHNRFRNLMLATAAHLKKTYFDDLELELVYIANDQQIQGLPGYTGTTADIPARNVQHAKQWTNIWLAALHAEKDQFLFDKLDFSYNFAVPFMYSGLVDKSDTVYDFYGNSSPSPSGEGEIGNGPNDSKDKRFEIRQKLNLNYQLFKPFALNLNNQLQYTDNRPQDDYADEYAGWQITPGNGKLLTSTTGFSGELKLFKEKWMTIAALKHYYFKSRGYETVLYPSANDSFLSDNEEVNTNNGLGWNIATRYKITPWFMLKGSYERGQRMPTTDEVFGDGFTIKTSPLLEPEKSDNFIAGFYIDKAFGEGPRAIRVTLESDAFLMYIDDMIRLGGTLTKNYANIDKAKIIGVDGELKLELTKYFYTYFNWTIQDVRNDLDNLPGTTQKNYLKGKRIPNIPPYFFNWGAEVTLYDIMWDWAKPCELSIFYDGSHVSEFFFEYEVSEFQKYRVDARVLHDAGVQLSMKDKRYSVSFSVDNIADTRHYDLYNQPLAGRIFKLALRGTFR
ncbi:MAG: TonB-dependent receptor [Deltaproteobacteria bacterium]|nr:TonB-dependent receptor [Deltaproteobacteria bacterium]